MIFIGNSAHCWCKVLRVLDMNIIAVYVFILVRETHWLLLLLLRV